MALSIKDPETEQLARELAKLTGETIPEATKLALAERLKTGTQYRGSKASSF